MRNLLVLGLVLGISGMAIAAPVSEQEPNDSFGNAQALPGDFLAGYGAGSVDGSLSVGDVDYYSVDLAAGLLATVSVFDFTPDDDLDNDSLLGIFTPGGALFDTDDDDGPGFLSSYHFFPTESGRWVFAVTGFGDDEFVGDHSEDFSYHAVVSQTIPEPTSIALLLAGGAIVAMRRRS